MKNEIDVGRRIKAIRTSKKMTQQDFAEMLGVSPQAVSKWENGESYPDIQLLIAIADRFELSLDDLLRDQNNEKQDEMKQEYQVYETIQNKSLSIDVEQVQYLRPQLFIHLIIKNKTKTEIQLANNHFLLLYEDGSQVDNRKYLQNHDGDVIMQVTPNEIPEFIPPFSSAKVKLKYKSTDSPVKLWINIPNECPNKCINIKPNLHSNQAQEDLVRSKNVEDIAYFYNYNY